MKPVDITNQRFGRLEAICRAGSDAKQKSLWICRCDCGGEIVARANNLRSGNTTSCGCYGREIASRSRRTHGASGTAEYMIWCRMIARCTNPQCSDYPTYGGRGITLCQLWRNSFESFLADMGQRPSPRHVIDRIDNDKGYEPGNCRWATPTVSSRNRRGRVLLTAFGETKCVSAWIDDPRCQVGYSVLVQRVTTMGWDHTRSITTPSRRAKTY